MRRTLIVALMALTGCTTIANGPMQRVRVASVPSGAVVRTEQCGLLATKRATTPAVVWVSRRSTQCRLVYTTPNYPEQRVRLRRHIARNIDAYGAALDYLCEGGCNPSDFGAIAAFIVLPSVAVDFATGAIFELEPRDSFAELTAERDDWRKSP